MNYIYEKYVKFDEKKFMKIDEKKEGGQMLCTVSTNQLCIIKFPGIIRLQVFIGYYDGYCE